VVTGELRAVVLTGYLEVARHVGLDPYEMLREAGVPVSILDDPENRFAARAIIDVLENSASKSGHDAFSLLLAECRSFANFGPLSLLIQHLPTFGDVFEALASHRRHQTDILTLAVENDGETVIARWDLVPEFATPQATQYNVAVAYGVLRDVSGGRWKPAAVHLARKAPQDLSVFKRVFSAPLEFESSFNGFSFDARAMTIPLPLANETSAAHARRLLQLMKLDAERETMTERTQRVIILLLPNGRAALEPVATNLGLAPRALQRSLEREGHSFGSLLRETRRELAKRYLIDSERPISSIADLTGYASLSAFGRWFTTEFGMAPQAWRAGQASWPAQRPMAS